MKYKIDRYSLRIIPENVTDVIFIEEVLGLKVDNQSCSCVRVNAMGLNCISHIKIQKAELKEVV